jgi:hypothetical protein
MGINSGTGKEIINFTDRGIYGMPALAGHLLRFNADITMPAWDPPANVHFNNVIAKVFIGQKFLGFAEPESSATFQPYQHAYKGSIYFEILLSPRVIEAIEKIRVGSGLDIRLEISGEARDPLNIMRGAQELIYRVNQTGWIEALKQMEYGSTFLFEFPIDIEPDDTLQKSMPYISRAKHHLLYGHYNEVIAECRQALEFLLPSKADLAKVRVLARTEHTEMNKSDRLAYFLDALNTFTQLSHHPDNSGNRASFTREEAVLVLGTTVSALSSKSVSKKGSKTSQAA